MTERIIGGGPDLITAQLAAIEEMGKRCVELVTATDQTDGSGELVKARKLLDDCRRLGTLPFSILARCGFIAEDWLRACVEEEIFTEKTVKDFKGSIKTVVSRFLVAVTEFHAGNISREEFNGVYGHLRPGTYDILSKRYDQRSDFIGGSGAMAAIAADGGDGGAFRFPEEELKALDRRLAADGYRFSAARLVEFIPRAIRGREFAKLEFTRNLSEALELIAVWGETSGLSREELSHLSVESLFQKRPAMSQMPVEAEKRREALGAMEEREVTLAVKLPFLITNLTDVDIIPLLKTRSNFVTHRSVRAPVTLVTGQEINPDSIKDRLVLIESADPGFDWIFLTRICGLITKYGGANSHMAIRCAELDIPAAIGCGEQVFDRLEKAAEAALDCGAELITPIG